MSSSKKSFETRGFMVLNFLVASYRMSVFVLLVSTSKFLFITIPLSVKSLVFCDLLYNTCEWFVNVSAGCKYIQINEKSGYVSKCKVKVLLKIRRRIQ